MGNLYSNISGERAITLWELFNLYNRNGGFNLKKNELVILSKFLQDKEINRLNEEIIALTIQLGRFEGVSPEQYLNKLLKNKRHISYAKFKDLMADVKNNEINQLLADAKAFEYGRLPEELNMV